MPAMVEAVSRLVRIPSWDGRETPAQEWVAGQIGDLGLRQDVWEIDLEALATHPQCAWEIERDHALGVVGSLDGRGTGRTLVLNGHVDVVPPGRDDDWVHPPFSGRVAQGRIHGRGALDMKGPLMAGLFAMAAVRSTGTRLAGTVRLQSVVGEEDGGLGTLATLLREGGADGAVVMEPTRLAVAPVQSGCLNFRVRVSGRAAHGAVREEGISAIEKLYVVYRALSDLETDRNAPGLANRIAGAAPVTGGEGATASGLRPFPISVGTVSGGDWASSVPDWARFEGRMGVRPDESLDDARRSLEEAVARTARDDPFLQDHPPTVEWWGGRFLPASTPVDHVLVRTLVGAVESERGHPPPLEAMPFGADAGLIQHVGRTPVVLFGAGDIRQAHRPDESISIGDLTTMARSLIRLIVRFCGPAS